MGREREIRGKPGISPIASRIWRESAVAPARGARSVRRTAAESPSPTPDFPDGGASSPILPAMQRTGADACAAPRKHPAAEASERAARWSRSRLRLGLRIDRRGRRRRRAGGHAHFRQRLVARRRARPGRSSGCAAPATFTGCCWLTEEKIALANPISSTTAANPIIPTRTRWRVCSACCRSTATLSLRGNFIGRAILTDRRTTVDQFVNAARRSSPFAASHAGSYSVDR
jgi:hypothetical protein